MALYVRVVDIVSLTLKYSDTNQLSFAGLYQGKLVFLIKGEILPIMHWIQNTEMI